jgi:hypothetical protein
MSEAGTSCPHLLGDAKRRAEEVVASGVAAPGARVERLVAAERRGRRVSFAEGTTPRSAAEARASPEVGAPESSAERGVQRDRSQSEPCLSTSTPENYTGAPVCGASAPVGGYLVFRACAECAELEAAWNEAHPTIESEVMTVRRRPPYKKVTCKGCRNLKHTIRTGLKASQARLKETQKEAKRRAKVAQAQTRTDWTASRRALKRRNSKPMINELRGQLKAELEETERAAVSKDAPASIPDASASEDAPASAASPGRARRQSLYSVTINL